jgi:hypothetical protein
LAATVRVLLFFCVSVSTALWPGFDVRACDRCVEFGTTAFHEEFRLFGGDSFDDTETPPEPPNEDLASAAFVLQGGKIPQPNGLGSPVTITYSFNNFLDGGLKDINGVSLPVPLVRGSVEH